MCDYLTSGEIRLDENEALRYNIERGQDTFPARFLSKMVFRRSAV